jgi:hypothetical protein
LLTLRLFKPSLDFRYLVVVALLGVSLSLVKPRNDIAIGRGDQSGLSVIINERHCLRDDQQSQHNHCCEMQVVANRAYGIERIPPRKDSHCYNTPQQSGMARPRCAAF